MESSSSLETGNPSTIVVGGGIAGLAAAYYLKKKAPRTRVAVLEAGSRWGGKITTARVPFAAGEFIVEGGPDTFLATKPYAVDLCKELGLAERLHGTNAQTKNTYVLHKGRLLPLPDGLAMMMPADVQSILQSELLSWPAKLRMGIDFILPVRRGNKDESLGAFVSRRLGRSAYENLIEPLMSGIYAGNGDRLSLASTFPYLRDLEREYGSIGRGALALRAKRAANGQNAQRSRSAFLTPTTGLAEIIEALIPRLKAEGVELRLRTRVRAIMQRRWSFDLALADGSRLESNALILATPAPVSGSIVYVLDPDLGRALRSIQYSDTATISLAYHQADVPRALDGYGYVIPRREGRRALACTWTSTKFPHRAPSGYALIRVFVGRAGEDLPLDEAELLALAKDELRMTLGIQAGPLISRVYRWNEAMPQYNLGHPETLSKIDERLARHPRLALAGNGYRGIGIPDCIHSGELAAESVLKSATVRAGIEPALTRS